MPDDRLFHKRAGRSQKVTGLSHLEFRVWWQYIESADDFGVMRFSALSIQDDNDALAKVQAKQIEKALQALIDSGLVAAFDHQTRRYLCQLDWQSFQKVDFPRVTINPCPPDDLLARCDALTQKLFSIHPGGKRNLKGRIPGELPESSGKSFDSREEAIGERLTADGKRQTANGSEGESERKPVVVNIGTRTPMRETLAGSHQNCASHSAGFCIPRKLYEKLQGLCRGASPVEAQRLVDAFLQRVDRDPRWQDTVPEADVFKFFDARWTEEQGGAPSTVSGKTAGNLAALKRWAGVEGP